MNIPWCKLWELRLSNTISNTSVNNLKKKHMILCSNFSVGTITHSHSDLKEKVIKFIDDSLVNEYKISK